MPNDTAAPAVRAKFHCFSTTIHDPSHGYAGTGVVLHAVYGDGTDNAAWSKATPQGKVELTVTVPGAAAAFVPGTEYWLDFTPVKAAPEQDAAVAVAKPSKQNTVSTDVGNLLQTGQDGLPYLSADALASASRAYPNEIQVGDVIDPVPEAGHDGPQYVTAVTQHPDGTDLELRPATPEEIAAQPSTGTYTTNDAPSPATPETPKGTYLGSMCPNTAVYLQDPAPTSSEPAPAQAA